ncbi:MAG: oligosaccharide flippase family protein, partial [Armatimonadetes bacterium]|nr:oligosaccharide flippase family protein [Armatimonadota bacterium]
MSQGTLDHNLKEIKGVAKHALIYGGGIVISKAVGFVMVPLYTRVLTPADYGLLELLTRGAEVAAIVLTLGFSTSVLRFYYDFKSEQDRNAVISSALVFSALVALVATVPLAAFSEQLSRLFLGTPDHRLFVLLLVFANLFELTCIVPMALLRAREESMLYTAVSISRLVLSLGLNIGLVAVLRLGVLGVLYSGLISGALTAIWLVALSVRKTGLSFSFAKIKPMLIYGLPLVPATLGMFILHSADRFFLSAYAGLDQVGLYALSYRFAMMLPVLIL